RGLAFGFLGIVSVPFGLVSLSVIEGFANYIFYAHAGRRVAGGSYVNAATGGVPGAFGILAEREFDAGSRAFEDQALGVLAPTHFGGQSLAADRVCGTMQNICRGNAARQRAIDGDIFGVDDVLDIDHGGNAGRPFIDPAIAANVRVAIDDSGSHVLILGIDDL